MTESASLSTQYGLGLASPPVENRPLEEPQAERPRTETISAQRYAPDKGYQTASGYYDPAASPPAGELDSGSGTLVDTWA